MCKKQADKPLSDDERWLCGASIRAVHDLIHTGVFDGEPYPAPLFRGAFTSLVVELAELLEKMRRDGVRYTGRPFLPQGAPVDDLTHLMREFRNTVCHVHSPLRVMKNIDGYTWVDFMVFPHRSADSYIAVAGYELPNPPPGDFFVGFGTYFLVYRQDLINALEAVRVWHRERNATADTLLELTLRG